MRDRIKPESSRAKNAYSAFRADRGAQRQQPGHWSRPVTDVRSGERLPMAMTLTAVST